MKSINHKFKGIELYFSPSSTMKEKIITIQGEEAKHILSVMRHISNDEIYITDGTGTIFQTNIKNTADAIVEAFVTQEYHFTNDHDNIYFCIPRLKSPDRFETALEKCTELGITHFIIFDAERGIPKGIKKERWEKIILSAMKQSLRSFLPDLLVVHSIVDIKSFEGKKILILQEAGKSIDKLQIDKDIKYYFIFGPEGDLSDEEKDLIKAEDSFNLGDYRLRSETAIIKCASLL